MSYNLDSLQLTSLFRDFDILQSQHGASRYNAIYGAGEIQKPKICLVFMNPTARNVSASQDWDGIRAPWVGTKNVWKMFYQLGIFTNYEIVQKIEKIKPDEWTPDFAYDLYSEVAKESIYITNIAKCTQEDARHVKNDVYKDYRDLMLQELDEIQPEATFAFGNQVSSVLLGRNISVSNYTGESDEIL
ncbi:hypothetical protein KC622_03730, partial [Candidatus Dojkabacteria bacterium]|nr:hypothetical protein [Candidatus Dojkabacteria bacterium]